jgi:hypothetical protein
MIVAAICLLTGTVYADTYTAEDTRPPAINSLEIVPGTVNTAIAPQTLTVYATIADIQSGVDGDGGVSCQFLSPSGQQQIRFEFYHGVPGQPDALVEGDLNFGRWQSQAELPQGSEEGQWQIEYFFVVDEAGNHVTYSAPDLAAEGYITWFTVENQSRRTLVPLVLRNAPMARPTIPPDDIPMPPSP